MNNDLTVNTPSRGYPVFVRETLPEKELRKLINNFESDKIFVLIDETVNRLHGSRIRAILNRLKINVLQYSIPEGETSKSVHHWNQIIDFLLENEIRRNNPVISIGGGVAGDLAGFAASTVLRGVPLIHMPTTLLAMVDSSIGGKTGINHSAGKNLIGSFYQPEAVIIDTQFLETLPENEWSNGLSEILKYGAIRDQLIFDLSKKVFLEQGKNWDGNKIIQLIRKCVKIKADIVEQDEKESGLRAILNFGHTFAHSLEKSSGYGTITHGEAVYIGMIAAVYLSNRYGSNIDEIRLTDFKPLYNINQAVTNLSSEVLINNMYSDKKVKDGRLRMVLLNRWQEPYLKEISDTETVRQAWDHAFRIMISD